MHTMEHTGPLSTLFLSHPGGGPAAADLEDCLRQFLQRCRAAWPGLVVPEPVFLRHLATHVSDCSEPGPALAALHAEDLYLACACAHGLPAALAAFDKSYLARVPAWLSGKAPRDTLPVLAQEVQQIMRERLLVAGPEGPPRIASYGGKAKLLSWVRVTCLRVVADLHRGAAEQRTEVREPAALDLLGSEVSPEMDLMKARHHQEFEDAFRAALLSLAGKQRTLLRLHLVTGMSIDKLGPMFKLSRATMARRLQDARQAVLNETERLLKERLGVSAGQVHSLARLLRSQVDVSLCNLLAQEKPDP